MKVVIYGVHDKGSRDKTNLIGTAMERGCRRLGLDTYMTGRFMGKIEGDIAIAYGWINELTDKVFSTYQSAGLPFVFVDLGYWDRGPEGHYRVGINDWDTAKHMKRGCPDDRFRALNVPLRDDWNRKSKKVMIVGMSGKAAWTHGYKEGEWENNTRLDLIGNDHFKKMGYEVYVRQKPNKQNRRMSPIEEDLRDCRFVVSHHSNVAVDALVAGVPYWAKKGVGSLLSPPEFDIPSISLPSFPDDERKMNLLHDIAYAQWTPAEMREGHCWNYIKEVLAI